MMSPYLAEFFGTMLLILLGNGVVAGVSLKGSKAENAGFMPVVLAWGMAVALAVFAVGRISNAHLNPAVTLAFFIKGTFESQHVVPYIAAQLAGAFVGAVLVWVHYLPHWKMTADPLALRGSFCTAPAIRSTVSNLISEIIGTTVLIMGLLFIGENKFADGLNPLVVGALISSIGFSLGGTTGFAINPARDLGPRVAHALLPISGKTDSDWSYSWIPVVGPCIGAVLGVFLFNALFA